jgi:hypothetical protein
VRIEGKLFLRATCEALTAGDDEAFYKTLEHMWREALVSLPRRVPERPVRRKRDPSDRPWGSPRRDRT